MLVLDHGLGKVSGRAGHAVFLLPGQWYFGGHGEVVRTLLGSCVALALWHPERRCGGMCHFLLPGRQRLPGAELDGRYGDEAVELLVQSMARAGTRPEDYLVELYGGADTMPDAVHAKLNVGERNIEKALQLIDDLRLQLSTVDVGGNEPRNVTLDLRNGQVELRRGQPKALAGVDARAGLGTPNHRPPPAAGAHLAGHAAPPHPVHAHRAHPPARPATAVPHAHATATRHTTAAQPGRGAQPVHPRTAAPASAPPRAAVQPARPAGAAGVAKPAKPPAPHKPTPAQPALRRKTP